MRIALFNLDSLSSAPAINLLFEKLGGRIGLVIASKRYGGRYGGFLRQTRRLLRRSSLRFLWFLGILYFWRGPIAYVAQGCQALRGRTDRCLTLRQLARRHGAAYLKTAEPNSRAAVAKLRAYAPDLIVVAHFDRVLRGPLLALPRYGIVNIHPSLLPHFRGPFPVFWALRHSAPRLGVTLHRIDSEMLDTGPILAQREIDRNPGDTVLSLDRRLFLVGADLLFALLDSIEQRQVHTQAQPPDQGSYYSFPSAADVDALRARGLKLFAYRDLLGGR